jgi:phage gp29-like protein
VDYTALVDRMNAAISKVYLGHTGSTDATPGKLGGEDNAGDVREDLVKADADLVCGSFSLSVARWLTFYNQGDVAAPKVWRKVEPPEDLKVRADTDKVVFDMGFKPTLKHVQDVYGGDYEAVTRPNDVNSGDAVNSDKTYSKPAPQTSEFAEKIIPQPDNIAEVDVDPTPISSMTDQLATEAGPAINQWLDTLRQKVLAAGSLEALRDDLLASYGDLDTGELTKVMSVAFAAAELSGRFDVMSE